MRIFVTGIFVIVLVSQGFSQLSSKWFHTYGNGYFDEGRGILQTPDSGYIVCGNTAGAGGSLSDILFFRTDSLGNQIYLTNIGGAQNDKAHAMSATRDGNYALAGFTESMGSGGFDFYLVKVTPDGDTVFTKAYGGSDWDIAYSIDTTHDNGFLMAGETYSYGNGNADGYLIKTNEYGDTLWTVVLGGAGDDVFRMIFEAADSTIYAIGTTHSFGAGGADIWLVALDHNGDTLFTKTYGTDRDDYGYSIDNYFDDLGNLSLMLGTTLFDTTDNFYKPKIIRISVIGNVLYDLLYISIGGNLEEDQMVLKRQPDYNNKFFFCGKARSPGDGDSYSIKLTTTVGAGFFGAVNTLLNPGSQIPYDVIKTFDKGYAVVGSTDYYGPGSQAAVIVKFDSLLQTANVVTVDVKKIEVADEGVRLGPNPMNDVLYIQSDEHKEMLFVLRDVQGRILEDLTITGTQQIQVSNYPSGLYFAEFVIDGSRYYCKLIKQ